MFSGQDENGTRTIETKMCLSALVSFTKCILRSYFLGIEISHIYLYWFLHFV